MNIILHICSHPAWDDAQIEGDYRAASLETERFVHCSMPDQVVGTANLLFRGQQNLVLLVIDADKVTAPIRFEDAGNGQLFPHAYGPINLDAIVGVNAFIPNADGIFGSPDLS